MTKHLQKLFALVLVCCAFLGSSSAWGQVSLQQSPYTENFDNLSSGYPSGWTGVRISGSGTAGELLAPIETDGSAFSGAVYSVGSGTDRALGTLASGSTVPTMGASFVNNTGNVLNQIQISAVLEQWRSGSSSSTNEKVVFEYSTNATAINDADVTWTAVTSLDLNEILTSSTSADAVDGNATSNQANISGELNALNWANGAIIWIRWTDSNDSGSDGMYAVDNFRLEFASSGTEPAIITPSSLNLGETLVNNPVVGEYTLSAANLTGDVNITTQAPFEVSKSATTGFASGISFTAAEVQANAKVYVRATPTTTGTASGTITHTSTGATNKVVAVTALSFSPFVQDFNNCVNGADITGGWMQYSVTGVQTWACTTFGMEGNGVQMSGYDGGANANQDWLISPKLDINSFTYPLLSFNYRTKFTGDALDVRVSTDYNGSGDPAAATWTTIETLEADDADAWKTFENFNLEAYKSANTHIAFVYTSTTSSAARWTLDNFELQNVANYINTSDFNLRFDETAVGNVSAPQQFTFEAKGFTEEVIVAAPANFELSKDGTTYASTLTYTPAEAATSNNVFVRFKPVTAVALSTGPVSFTSGTEPSVTRGMLSGSSILRSATLDVATWNLEWFGSTSNGPSDEDLQFANVRLGLDALDADIIALQEVVDETRAQQLAQQLGYSYISEKITDWQASNDQIVAFMYNPDVVTVKKEKVLLKKLYQDIRSGSTTLTDYPTGNSNLLWASGRLPYLVQFEASIDGVKQTYNLINIHAKANDGDDMVQYNRRKYDLQVLKDTLDAQYANMNLILLGDYNDDVDVSVVGTGNASTYEAFVTDEDYIALTYDLSTTGATTYGSGSLQSFLDHQIISSTLQEEYIENSINIESQLLSLIPNYRSTTSDHLPVSARYYVQTETTTGIADATKGQFRVYPNPFVTSVKLDLPERVTGLRNISLVVYGVEGRKLLEATGTQEAVQQQLNDNLNKLSKGLYIIKVEAGSELFQSRMLKQ